MCLHVTGFVFSFYFIFLLFFTPGICIHMFWGFFLVSFFSPQNTHMCVLRALFFNHLFFLSCHPGTHVHVFWGVSFVCVFFYLFFLVTVSFSFSSFYPLGHVHACFWGLFCLFVLFLFSFTVGHAFQVFLFILFLSFYPQDTCMHVSEFLFFSFLFSFSFYLYINVLRYVRDVI